MTLERPTQAARILTWLANRQPHSVSNVELCENICFTYSARIFELRRAGFDIETITDKGSLRHFRLITPERLIDWETMSVKQNSPDQAELAL